MIRTDCYLAVLGQFRQAFPDAYFEVVTRQTFVDPKPHVLSPSWNLLKHAKSEGWTFEQYTRALLAEWDLSMNYQFMDSYQPINQYTDKLHELYWISQLQDLYLCCVEKLKGQCHREIIRALLWGLTPKEILTNIHDHHDCLCLTKPKKSYLKEEVETI